MLYIFVPFTSMGERKMVPSASFIHKQ